MCTAVLKSNISYHPYTFERSFLPSAAGYSVRLTTAGVPCSLLSPCIYSGLNKTKLPGIRFRRLTIGEFVGNCVSQFVIYTATPKLVYKFALYRLLTWGTSGSIPGPSTCV